MDGTLHIDGRVSDAMVVRAMRAVAIDGLGMPADFVRRTRVPQVLVDLLREHPCPHGPGNIRLPFGFSVCTCCLDPHMNTPARLMVAHKDVAGAKPTSTNEGCDLGVPSCGGGFTSFKRVVS